jgi:hypothetical protein
VGAAFQRTKKDAQCTLVSTLAIAGLASLTGPVVAQTTKGKEFCQMIRKNPSILLGERQVCPDQKKSQP